jgi:ribonuclease D
MSARSSAQKTSPLPLPVAVTATAQLDTLLETLLGQPVVAVDTESNSLYAYQERVCLIQFSIPGADYVVDPLAGLDLSSLADLFADDGIQKVFHAAEYDVMCLKRDFGFRFANLFDTMWAGRILGWPRVGLGDVLKEIFGVRTKKRYQRYNWGRRPLEPEALTYASIDTHYLLDLRRLQADALMERGCWGEAREIFDQVAASEPSWQAFDPEGFWRVKGAHDLAEDECAVLRELWIWRDNEARRRDRPHFKVLTDHALFLLARASPCKSEDLIGVDGLKPYHVRRYGRGILRAVRRGMCAPVPRLPPPPPRRPDVEVARFRALRAWRKQVADERGVENDVIVGNAVLWALARQNPRSLADLRGIEGLGPWRRRTYGEAILGILAGS